MYRRTDSGLCTSRRPAHVPGSRSGLEADQVFVKSCRRSPSERLTLEDGPLVLLAAAEAKGPGDAVTESESCVCDERGPFPSRSTG